jgi:hypothetical protein
MVMGGKLPHKCQYVIYDEIHKYARWRDYIKGAFDRLKNLTKILARFSSKILVIVWGRSEPLPNFFRDF